MSNNACTWSYAFTIFSRCWHPFIFWVPSAFVSRSLLLGLGWSSTFSQDSCHLRASSISEPWIPDAGSEGWRVQHELCSEMIAYENLKHASHTLGRKVRSRAKHWEHKCFYFVTLARGNLLGGLDMGRHVFQLMFVQTSWWQVRYHACREPLFSLDPVNPATW